MPFGMSCAEILRNVSVATAKKIEPPVGNGRLRTHGPAPWSACWAYESANALLRSIGQTAHAAVWHNRVLSSWVTAENTKRRRTTWVWPGQDTGVGCTNGEVTTVCKLGKDIDETGMDQT